MFLRGGTWSGTVWIEVAKDNNSMESEEMVVGASEQLVSTESDGGG